MIRRPPRSTRTDTLFPYTTLFRSVRIALLRKMLIKNSEIAVSACFSFIQENRSKRRENVKVSTWKDRGTAIAPKNDPPAHSFLVCSQCELNTFRSAGRRVGKEFLSTCRSRGAPSQTKKQK